ncbi:MAG: hypothetical protein LM632_02340 [Armatimonadetes bacterium]|jgi:hypothetical protein|nr:hypothetical protein [Armatimonadota bacterium]
MTENLSADFSRRIFKIAAGLIPTAVDIFRCPNILAKLLPTFLIGTDFEVRRETAWQKMPPLR